MTPAEHIQEAKAQVEHARGGGLPLESPTLGKLAEALAKAQGAMGAAAKDSTNPHFKSRYADLASIREVIREPLASNGLAFFQRTSTGPGGVRVETTLVHVSGEFVRDSCWLPVAQQTPQAYGSAITYARRYSLAALLGVVADEDDDGNAAAGTQPALRPSGWVQAQAQANQHSNLTQVEQLKQVIREKQARSAPTDEPPPPSDEDAPFPQEPQAPTPGDFEIAFGKAKGKMASSLTDKDLAWYGKVYRENAADPAKARFKDSNAAAAAALQAIAEHRGLP